MTTPLFSTYRQGENRVTASFLAVLERLSLPNMDRILQDLVGERYSSIIVFKNQPKGDDSRPDAKIETRPSIWIETKTARNAVRVSQIKDHLKVVAANETLLLLTPDRELPNGLPDDDRLQWTNFDALAESVGDVLKEEKTPPTESEAFLLRELVRLIDDDKLLNTTGPRVAVVAARLAWPEYQSLCIYKSHAYRPFQADYVAFYRGGQIEALVPKLQDTMEWDDWVAGETTENREDPVWLADKLGEANKDLSGARKDFAVELHHRIATGGLQTEFGARPPFKINFLSGPDDVETVRLEQPVANDKKDRHGNPAPLTYGAPRYVTLDSLRNATNTSDLKPC